MLTIIIHTNDGKQASKKINTDSLAATKSYARKAFNLTVDADRVEIVNANNAILSTIIFIPEVDLDKKSKKWHDFSPADYGNFNSFDEFKVEYKHEYENGVCVSAKMEIIPLTPGPRFVINPNQDNGENMPNVRIIPMTKNKKTGDIPQTYTACTTCPVTACENKKGKVATLADVCYCANGYGTRQAWRQTDEGKFLTVPANMLSEFIAKVLPVATFGGALIRHNIGGDLCKAGTNDIDSVLLNYLLNAYKEYKAFTYTHAAKTPQNLALANKATKAGFTINISCSNLRQVELAKQAGCESVLTVSTMKSEMAIIKGYKLLRCPAVPDDSTTTCETCRKCWLTADKGRDYTIVFPLHGVQKKQGINSGRYLDI